MNYSDQQAALIGALIDAREQDKLTQQQMVDRLGQRRFFVATYGSGERRLDVIEFLQVGRRWKRTR